MTTDIHCIDQKTNKKKPYGDFFFWRLDPRYTWHTKNIVTSSWPATLKSILSIFLSNVIHPFQSPHYQLWAAAAGLCDGGGAGGLWVIVLAAGLFWHFIRQWDLCSEQSLSNESVPLALCVWRPANTDMN